MADGFSLDPRLAGTSVEVGDWPLCHVRLADDARWPWLLLIPRRAGAVELFDLSSEDRAVLVEEASRAAEIVRDLIQADKTNVATLGNQVPQMHVHVIGRLKGDAGWPGPIWGVGEAEPYMHAERERLVVTIRDRM
ncbi:MAG: HIT family protein [Minwuia sp.]|uniref:HIT family protein n=1 Tax=Minwuia sp. TaxID=2493630 RepID=UPI003A89196C